MTTNDEGTHNVNLVTTKGNVMTARRTSRKTVSTDIVIDDVIDHDMGTTADEVVPAPPARKYMSHEGCDHARKGEAGKAARQVCRRNHRAWFAAEAEYLASIEESAIAV